MITFVLLFYALLLGLMGIGMMIAMRKAAKEMTFTQDEIDSFINQITKQCH
jgi:hypothetical protein